MKLDLLFLPSEVREAQLEKQLVIVTDVLRASSTIVTALHHGAKEIIPVESLEDATRLMQDIGRKYVILCGEREGKKIDQFDLGNSPFEYTNGGIKDKTLIYCSTNGSRAIVRAASAGKLVMAGFLNLSYALDYAIKSDFDQITILCSGKEDRFCLEDVVCAGMMVSRLLEEFGDDLEASDAATAGLQIYNQHQKNIPKMIKTSDHGKYLAALGFGEDLIYCSQIDALPVVPVLENGRIVKSEQNS